MRCPNCKMFDDGLLDRNYCRHCGQESKSALADEQPPPGEHYRERMKAMRDEQDSEERLGLRMIGLYLALTSGVLFLFLAYFTTLPGPDGQSNSLPVWVMFVGLGVLAGLGMMISGTVSRTAGETTNQPEKRSVGK